MAETAFAEIEAMRAWAHKHVCDTFLSGDVSCFVLGLQMEKPRHTGVEYWSQAKKEESTYTKDRLNLSAPSFTLYPF